MHCSNSGDITAGRKVVNQLVALAAGDRVRAHSVSAFGWFGLLSGAFGARARAVLSSEKSAHVISTRDRATGDVHKGD